MYRRALIFVMMAVAVSGCAGGGTSFGVPATPANQSASGAHQAAGNDYYPGENAHGLPGGNLPCTPPVGQITQCTLVININVPPNPLSNLPASLVAGLHPADLTNAYHLPSSASGGTVAIVDAYDDPLAEVEMAAYRLVFGLPPCLGLNGCFKKVNQSGQSGSYPPLNLGWAQETALDLEMVSAACPRCHILLVEANSASLSDLGAAVDEAATFRPLAISNSYYAPEWSSEQREDSHFHHPGIAITASSGDHHAPSYPAASPYVLAVGGTTLSGGAGHWNETPWLYSGGGCSAYVSKPAWQSGSQCATRRAVDIAVVADPSNGVGIFSIFAGGWVEAGGTSIGAPLAAAAYALNSRADSPSFSYSHAGSFQPVLPNAKTGLGSPIGVGGF